MRIFIILIGMFILANVVLFLLPTQAELNNLKYTSKPLVNESDVRLVSDLSQQKSVLKVDESALANADVAPSDSSNQQNSATALKAMCYRIGPFLRESRMQSSGERLKSEMNLTYNVVVRESTDVPATRVYLGPFPGKAEAMQAREELTEAGISDHFHKREQGAYIVSLGIYSNESSAREQVSRFRALNVNAKLKTKLTKLPKSYWLEVGEKFISDDFSRLKSFSWGESSVSLSKSLCSN